MTKTIFLLTVILLLVFGSLSVLNADSKGVDKRDIIVDNAIGGMSEGSRITAPDRYDRKTAIPKIGAGQLSPLDTGAADTAATPGAGERVAQSIGEAGGIDTGIGSVSGTGVIEEQPIGNIEGPGETGAGGIDTEPTGTTPDTGGSLIDLDVGVGIDDSGVQTDVSLGLDTEQQDQILDADLGAGVSESVIDSETDIGTEVDTSGSSVGSEADIGVEADIEGGGEGDDIADDPADGLPSI